jgi:hypothetical protein
MIEEVLAEFLGICSVASSKACSSDLQDVWVVLRYAGKALW